MKNLILITLLTISSFVFGQARIGYSISEITAEFIDYKTESGFTDDLTFYINVPMTGKNTVYYFKNGYCNFTAVIPINQGALNYIVEQYNSKYVIISDTEWQMYSKDGILECQLKFEDFGYYFIWYQKQ